MELSDYIRPLAYAVQEYRKNNNLNKEDCAKELGIGRTSLIKIENLTANPTLATIITIAQRIGVDPISLFCNSAAPGNLSAILLMSCLENGTQYSLETLQTAADHFQAFVQTLTDAQQAFPQKQETVLKSESTFSDDKQSGME